MSKKDTFDDYMHYKLSGSKPDSGDGNNGGLFPVVLGVLIGLWLIVKLFF